MGLGCIDKCLRENLSLNAFLGCSMRMVHLRGKTQYAKMHLKKQITSVELFLLLTNSAGFL